MDMTPEFIALAFVLILAILQISAAAIARTAELGAKWNAGPRDEAVPPPGKLAGRLMRAQANLFETLPLFAAAVIMAHVAGKDGGALTLWGTHLYLLARVLYVPLYAFGVTGLRSLAFIVSLAGLIMVIWALFV
ncbi:MAPEG family protein [Brevundimonas goettingensis]|nr:MAPEG family protein [Brevundimonas goettingensis]